MDTVITVALAWATIAMLVVAITASWRGAIAAFAFFIGLFVIVFFLGIAVVVFLEYIGGVVGP